MWCWSCGHDVDMVKDASESLVWGVTNGLARGKHHLLARPRKIVTWQRPNLKGESKESWNMITGSSTVSCERGKHYTLLTTVLPRMPVSTTQGFLGLQANYAGRTSYNCAERWLRRLVMLMYSPARAPASALPLQYSCLNRLASEQNYRQTTRLATV